MLQLNEIRNSLVKAAEDMSQNEWAVSHWREDAIKNISCIDAFESILPTLELALEQIDSYLFESCCGLALQLARVAQTTEQPDGLIDIMKKLIIYEQKLTQDNRNTNELAQWFRISGLI